MKEFLKGRAFELQKNNFSIRAIAQRLRVSWHTAKRLTLPDEPRVPKAVRKSVEQRRRRLTQHVISKNLSCRQIRSALKLQVSARTIARDLRAKGYVARVRPTTPCVDERVFEKRAAFGKQHASGGEGKVFYFVDEVTVSTNDHSSRKMWVKKGAQPTRRERRRKSESNSLQVWCAIGPDYRRIVVLNAPSKRKKFPRGRPRKGEIRPEREVKSIRLNAEKYMDLCLKPFLKDVKQKKNAFLYQDNARCHISQKVLKFIAGNKMKVVADVPPYSPQLNMIEQIFPRLHEEISKLRPSTVEELETAALKAWSAIPADLMNKTVAGFQSRCETAWRTQGRL